MIVELEMFWSDMKEGKWMKTSLIFSASIGTPRSCARSVHRQDYDVDAATKLHSCWHSFNLIFFMQSINSVCKRESTDEPS